MNRCSRFVSCSVHHPSSTSTSTSSAACQSIRASRSELASLPLSGELICLVPWRSLLALINRWVTLPLQRQTFQAFIFPLNYLESQWGARSSQPHTSCKNTPTDSHNALRPFFPLSLFILVASSGAGGAVSVQRDGKLRAELALMAAAERSEGWFYGWSRVFFLRFKGLSEREGPLAFTGSLCSSLCSTPAQSICAVIKQQSD